MNLEIYNETNTDTPNFPFEKIKDQILGKGFELQISILLPKNSQKINKKQRGQTYVPNTLSFKYSKNSGEIVLTPEVIDNEDYDIGGKILTDFEQKFLYLVIHSMIHLTDLDHGTKMEKLEEKFFKKFK
jgi:rRNA maturation RNase YbeY